MSIIESSDCKKEYFAFISYQKRDEQEAKWLQHQLEHYHLPSNVAMSNPLLPQNIRPIFRDTTELSGGILPIEIEKALNESQYLIVICSPNSSKSEWVNKEVQLFIDSGKLDKIIPYIIEGRPYSKDKSECFVPAIVNLEGTNQELLGINISEMGREVASIKVVARMLNLKFDKLWQRYEREKEEEKQRLIDLNHRILKNQARFISEKASQLTKNGNSYLATRLLLEVLPSSSNPDYPYTIEAEIALRQATSCDSALFCGHFGNVNSISVSKNGERILTASDDSTIRLWETITGRCLAVYKGHTDSVNSVVFLPDNKHFLSGSDDKTLRLWNLETQESDYLMVGHFRSVCDVCLSENNNTAFSVSKDKTIRAWNLKTGKQTKVFHGHNSPIASVACSNDGRLLVTGSWDKTIRIWDVNTGECINTLVGHQSNVVSVCVDSLNKTIASLSWDNTMRIWNFDTGKCIWEESVNIDKSKKCSVNFSNNGKYIIASFDLYIYIWHTNRKEKLYVKELLHGPTQYSIFLNNKCTKIVYGVCENVCLIDVQPNGSRLLEYQDWRIEVKEIFIDNKHDSLVVLFNNSNLSMWNIGNEKKIRGIFSFNNLHTIIFLEKDPIAVTTTADFDIELWDCVRNTKIQILKGHTSRIKHICFSAQINMLISLSEDGVLCLWDLSKMVLFQKVFFLHNVSRMIIGANGQRFAVQLCINDKSIIIIGDFTNNTKPYTLGSIYKLRKMEFSSSCKLIVTLNHLNWICIWNTENSECIHKIENESGLGFLDFNISENENYIVTTTNVGFVQIYDIYSGVCISETEIPNCKYVRFCMNDTKIIVSVRDIFEKEEIRIFDFLPLEELVKRNKERFKSFELTDEEKRQYYLE